MDERTRRLIVEYVRQNIGSFHEARIDGLKELRLRSFIKRKNPYLFRAKNLNSAADLIEAVLNAYLSSSEEGHFGTFLEHLAIYVAQLSGAGQKSPATGIDIDLTKNNVRYLIAVKSGKNWGNSSQKAKLKDDFRTAVRVLRQSRDTGQLQPTLGICYGSFKTKDTGEYLHIGGQSFWELISGDPDLYKDIVEPLGQDAEKHDRIFREEKDKASNRLIHEFTSDFCNKDGAIDWPKLVEFVCGNLPKKNGKGNSLKRSRSQTVGL